MAIAGKETNSYKLSALNIKLAHDMMTLCVFRKKINHRDLLVIATTVLAFQSHESRQNCNEVNIDLTIQLY